MKLYYDIYDVKNMTGVSTNKCYEIIRELNKKFKKKYPDCELIQGKILKKFYDESMGLKSTEDN